MNIQTILLNLDRTILVKETLLVEFMPGGYQWTQDGDDATSRIGTTVIQKMLKINIDELKVIRDDVLKCIEDTK